jgi:hypothetical protein
VIRVTSQDTRDVVVSVSCEMGATCFASLVLDEPRAVVPQRPEADPKSDSPFPFALAGYTLLAVGGTGVVAGAIFALVASGKNADARFGCTDTLCTSRDARRDKIDEALTFANLSTGFVIGGSVLLASGLLMVLFAPSGKSAVKPSGTLSTSAFLLEAQGLKLTF